MGARAAPHPDDRRCVPPPPRSLTFLDAPPCTSADAAPLAARAAGFLYDDFSSTHDYELVVNYAREIGAIVFDEPRTRKVFVTADGHLQVRCVALRLSRALSLLVEVVERLRVVARRALTSDPCARSEFIKRRMAAAQQEAAAAAAEGATA